MAKVSFFSKLWNCVFEFVKTFKVVAMKRLLSKLINRALLTEPFGTIMGGEAGVHTNSRRRLIVGLGNPGMNGSRHSVGMAVLEALSARLGVADRWRGDRQVSGEVIVSDIQDTQIVLLRPRLLMNINGVSVAKAAGKYGIKPEDILLVHDELDKPLGKLGMKQGGSARGHNGVRSCVECLQTDVMPRLRVGIGRPTSKMSVERHVLGRFSKEEQKVLGGVLEQCVDTVLSQLTDTEHVESPPGGRPASRAGEQRERSRSPPTDSTGQT
ncbi:probable peptidyl-tRNA hydrolase [Esox lucius]|uniref:peptidyl-tRNA hydrolase n=1 Tax=Esox lucius TaxID=8010 RepID=A0A3P8YHE1_ESOLU|nr:probable peptidyl-tRNA hydrolase [Esox lucius]